MRKYPPFLVSTILIAIILTSYYCNSMPLSTQNRWIMDDTTGKRVKLTCSHWVAHMEPMLVEGLDKLPIHDIATQIANSGFNCVRLSYATYMFTRYATHTVRDTLSSLDIPEVVMTAIEKHNPLMLNMTHVQAYEAAIGALGEKGVMVLIDNHVSMPMWCCDNNDQNGFFGDRHFHPSEWLQGLAFIAKHFKGKHNVSNHMIIKNHDQVYFSMNITYLILYHNGVQCMNVVNIPYSLLAVICR